MLRDGHWTSLAMLTNQMKAQAAISYLFLVVTIFLSSASLADQTAPELPGLFTELANATDQTEANRIEGQIWQHWLDAPDAESTTLMSQISQAMAGADLAVALSLSDQLVKSHPNFAEAWNKRATVHYMLGNNAKSVDDIRETIALEPRHFGAISGLGLIFLRSQDYESALEAFRQVLSVSPASINAQRSVNRVLQELGREI